MTDSPKITPKTVLLAALFDLAALLIFTAIGRASHERALDVSAFLVTLWPFLAGAIIGWLLTRSWKNPLRVWPNGVAIWVNTVVFGMFFRVMSSQGVQLSFIIVASLVTGILLIGWRLVARFVGRGRAARQE